MDIETYLPNGQWRNFISGKYTRNSSEQGVAFG